MERNGRFLSTRLIPPIRRDLLYICYPYHYLLYTVIHWTLPQLYTCCNNTVVWTTVSQSMYLYNLVTSWQSVYHVLILSIKRLMCSDFASVHSDDTCPML